MVLPPGLCRQVSGHGVQLGDWWSFSSVLWGEVYVSFNAVNSALDGLDLAV